MNRLLRACANQQIRQTKTRTELFQLDCASRCVIVAYFRVAAGDYFERLLAPTIRGLQGPWTANEAGLKGVLEVGGVFRQAIQFRGRSVCL